MTGELRLFDVDKKAPMIPAKERLAGAHAANARITAQNNERNEHELPYVLERLGAAGLNGAASEDYAGATDDPATT